jgi:DNA repair protein RadC
MENTNEKRSVSGLPAGMKCRQVAEIQLTYRSGVKPSLRPKISGSRDAYKVLLENWDGSKIEFVEQFKVLLLNRANKVLGIFEVSSGSATGTVADPKVIFAAAIKSNACGIILAHNHPSGNLQPSQADIDLTRRMKEGGKLLEIQVLDHVILTSEGYYSFADEGLL